MHMLSEEKIDEGFDYIAEKRPRTNSNNKQLRWATKELSNKNSSLHGWSERMVKEALRNLSSDGVLAFPCEDLTLNLYSM